MALQQSLGLGVEITLKDQFTQVAAKITASYAQLRASITAGSRDITQAGQMISQSMGRIGGAATTTAKGKGGGARGGLEGIQKVIGGVTVAMGALAGVAGGFHAFDSLTETAGRFDKQIASAGAIMNASAGDMKVLEKAAIDAGIATQFSPIEAAQGLELLGQSGYNAAEATKLLIPTLDLAAGGQISVAQAAATTSAAVKVFGLNIDQAKGAVDKLLRISNATSFTAADLQISLGNVSRGAIATGQSLDEMLPSMGLVKNAGVDASVASSAVSSALLMVAKNSKKFKNDIGVNVTDAAGNFRPFLDIIYDTDKAMSKKFPNAAVRSAKAMELFGKFGLSAFTSISAQLNSGITGADGAKVKGLDAIKFLRESMATASGGDKGGAAAEFRSRLLDTFEGQKTLLRGSIETLAVTIGQSLTQAFRPVVEGVIAFVNKIIAVVQDMPPEVKAFAAKFAIAAASFGSFALAAVGVGVAIASIAEPVMAVIGSLGTLLPIVTDIGAVFGAIGAVIGTFSFAAEENIGGFADFIGQKFNQARLFVLGFAQVFSTGQITGPLADELSKAENGGVTELIGRVYAGVNQVKMFIDNVISGFKDSVRNAGPIFQELSTAVENLLSNFSGLTDAVDGNKMSESFNKTNGAGYSMGSTISKMVLLVISGLTLAINFVDGFVKAWDKVSTAFAPVIAAIGGVFGFIGELANEFFSLTSNVESSGNKMGAVGQYFAGIWAYVGSVVSTAISFIKNMFVGLGSVFFGVFEMIYGLLTGNFTMVWVGLKRVVFGFVTQVISWLGLLVEGIALAIDQMGALVGKDLGLARGAREFKEGLIKDMKEGMGLGVPIDAKATVSTTTTSNVVPEQLAAPANDLFATTDAVHSTGDQYVGSALTSRANNEEVVAAINNLAKRPIDVNVSIDGRDVASSTSSASADEASRGYSDNAPEAD